MGACLWNTVPWGALYMPPTGTLGDPQVPEGGNLVM